MVYSQFADTQFADTQFEEIDIAAATATAETTTTVMVVLVELCHCFFSPSAPQRLPQPPPILVIPSLKSKSTARPSAGNEKFARKSNGPVAFSGFLMEWDRIHLIAKFTTSYENEIYKSYD
ncbi:hypothetical protein QTP88_010206 [Uroleucon formosanum]